MAKSLHETYLAVGWLSASAFALNVKAEIKYAFRQMLKHAKILDTHHTSAAAAKVAVLSDT